MIFIAVAVTFARTIDVQLLGGSWRRDTVAPPEQIAAQTPRAAPAWSQRSFTRGRKSGKLCWPSQSGSLIERHG